MSSSKESTSKTSAGCEPPTRHNIESNSLDYLIDEIDKFLNEYTSDSNELPDGNELPSNTNATESFEELNREMSEINANNLKNKTTSKEKLSEELPSITPERQISEEIKCIHNVNKKTSSEPNDIKYVGKNAAVFQLLEENESYGVYEYIPNVNNWNVFYKPLPDDQQIQYVKKEPGTDYINNLSNLSFSQYPIIKLEPESIEADNQNQNSADIKQNDLNEISQIWNQPEFNFQQKNINQVLQIQKKRNENIKIPIENPDNSTKYTVYNSDPVKSDIITSTGRRWNHNYKQNNYSDAGHIPPNFKNNIRKNNYKQSDGHYRSTYSKQNVFKNNFKRPFYKTPQENYSSSTHRPSGFNLHSNRFNYNKTIQKPNRILQGINQFGPHMPFKRYNKESNMYNGIYNSQNEKISQNKSNINDKYFHNFQLPFVPPTNEINEPKQDFSELQLSLNQPDFNYGIQNQCSEDSRFGSKHEQNLYMKNNVSVFPNWSNSYDHLNNNNMEVPKSGRKNPYNQSTTKTNINIQNRKEKKSYNQHSIHNNFKMQNIGGNDSLNFLTPQNNQIEKNDEYEPYNQYSTNNSSEIHINGRNGQSNRFSTNQSIKIKNSECNTPSTYYPAKKNIEVMQKSSTNATYNQNLKNKHFKIQNRDKNESYDQYSSRKNIEMHKNGENQPYDHNATQKNIKKEENDEKSHLSLSTTKNSNKKKICIGIEEYKYYANNKKNIDMHKSMQVGPYNSYSTKENEEQKTMGFESYKDYSINKNVKMENSGGHESCNHFSTKKSIEMQNSGEQKQNTQYSTLNNVKITPNNETAVTLVDGKESLNCDGYKYTPVMSLQESHYLIKDYLSPESLVGCTIKLSSRKLANAEIRGKLYTAFAVHGALSNSWWTSDDMFFVTYFERNVALGVYDMYPINTSSSY